MNDARVAREARRDRAHAERISTNAVPVRRAGPRLLDMDKAHQNADRVVDRHICPAAGTSSSTNQANTARSLRPHPAIEELLSRIGVARPAPASDRDHEWLRLPGLFRRWEIEQVTDVDEEYLVEDAGRAPDGTPLFAIYSRLPIDLRSRCGRLQMSTVSEVSRETGVPRGTVREAIGKLRTQFEHAGLAAYPKKVPTEIQKRRYVTTERKKARPKDRSGESGRRGAAKRDEGGKKKKQKT
jgi:hypothetical protein